MRISTNPAPGGFTRVVLVLTMSVAMLSLSGIAGSLSTAASVTAEFSARGIPPTGQALLGAATSSDIAAFEATVGGTMGVHRLYYSSGQVTAAVSQASADLARGRIPWLSFKAPFSWTAMATGAGDAWARDLAHRLGDLNGPVWIAVHHEPEGSGPAADWKKMQQHLAPIFRAEPNIAYTIILMGWKQFFTSDPSVSMDAYWPGKQYVDVMAFDPYNWYGTTSKSGSTKKYSWTELRDYYEKINQWRTATGNGSVPWAIAETGYTDLAASVKQGAISPAGNVVSTRGSGADWLTRAFDDMKAMGGIAMSYFNIGPSYTSEPSDWTWPVESSTKIGRFRAALGRSTHYVDGIQLGAPSTPTGLTAVPSGPSGVTVAWTAAQGATSYFVFRDGSLVATTPGTSYADSGLAAGATYAYSVSASNLAGSSPVSASVSASTQTGSTTSAPVKFRASATFSGNVTRSAVVIPSATQAGDTMILFASTNNGQPVTGVPAGWNKVGQRSNDDLWTGLWTRRAASGDAGTPIEIPLPGYVKVDLTLLVYAGLDEGQPIAVGANSVDSTKTTLHRMPPLSLQDGDSWVLAYWVDRSSEGFSWSLTEGQVRRAWNAGVGGGHLTSVAADIGRPSPAGEWASLSAVSDSVATRATMWAIALTP